MQVQHLRGSRPRCTRKEPATARAVPYPLYIGQREEHRCVLSQRTAWMLFLGSRFPGQAEFLLVSTSRPQPPRFPHRRVGTPWAGRPKTGPGAARGSQGCPGIFLPCQIPRPSREEQHPALQLPPPGGARDGAWSWPCSPGLAALAERSWAGSSPRGSDGHEAQAWGFGEELELVPPAGFPAALPFTSPDFLLDSASRRRAKSRPAPQAAHYCPALPSAGSSCSN